MGVPSDGCPNAGCWLKGEAAGVCGTNEGWPKVDVPPTCAKVVGGENAAVNAGDSCATTGPLKADEGPFLTIPR